MSKIETHSPDDSELSAFVSSTLRAIFDGVFSAHGDCNAKTPDGQVRGTYNMPKTIEFDIAIAAKKTDEKSGGLKLEVFSFGASGKAEKSHEDSKISRVKFSVPCWATVVKND